MKTENIKNVINRLIESNEYAILISGAWGIGKTYEIQEYIKSKEVDIKEKKIKIAYTSLFGKNSLDEVNTELYQIFHPAKKVLNVITNVAKLINVGVGLSCGINLNLNEDKLNVSDKLKLKKKIPSLIILDDFERKSDKISSEELLGFINNLTNQGFKVVVLADLDAKDGKKNKKFEITKVANKEETVEHYISKINFSDDILGVYKEKIFDRIYKITDTPEDVIKTLFGEDYKYINDKMLKEFNDNIRMAIKANSLFLQIKAYINSKSCECNKFDLILKICIYCVNELMSHKYTAWYDKECSKSNYMKYNIKSFENAITSYDSALKEEHALVEAVNNIYLNEDYKYLDGIFEPQDNILQSCFYFSDDNKVNIIKKQYELILSIPEDNNYSHSILNQMVRDWYCYAHYVDLSFIDKEKLFDKLNKLSVRLDGFGERNQTYLNIIQEYEKYCEEQVKYTLTSQLESMDKQKIKHGLYEIYHRYTGLDDESKKFIQKCMKNNNFFLQNIDGDIDYESWSINHLICQMVSEIIPEVKDCLLHTLNDIKTRFKDDLSCSHRIDTLVHQYKLEVKYDENN